MICVDNDREIVAKNVLEFSRRGAAGRDVGARQRAAHDARGADGGGRRRSSHKLAARRPRRICANWRFPTSRGCSPAPTRCRVRTPARPSRRSRAGSRAGGAPRFTAFGTPVFNRGVALRARARWWRATSRRASNRTARCCSRSTAASCSRRAGSPTRSSCEDAFFGAARSRRQRAVALEAAFDAATAAVEDADQARPTTTTLLALYSLYKQAGSGDVDRRASGRARHGRSREVRRVGEAQGRVARRRDARLRRAGGEASRRGVRR